MRERILLILSCLAVGFAAGFVVRSIAVESEADDALVGGSDAGLPPEVTARRSASGVGAAAAREASESGSMRLADLVGSVDLGPRPAGDHSFRGAVRTTSGEGLARVVISVRSTSDQMPRWTADADPSDPTLEAALRQTIASRRWAEMTSASAETGADGSYVIAGLADLRYTLTAESEGYYVRLPHGQPSTSRPDAVVDFVAEWRPVVPVSIVLADGTVPERATVSLRRSPRDGAWPHAWRARSPELRIPAGHWLVEAALDGDDDCRSDIQEIDVVEGERPAAVVLTLREQPGVRGRIIVPAGLEMQPEVFLLANFTAADVTDSVLRNHEVMQSPAASDSYRFRFAGVEPGAYLLGVSTGRRRLIHSERIQVGASMITRDIEIPAPDPADYVVVRVEDPDGHPVDDVHVGSAYRSARTSSSGGDVVRRSDGAFLVYHQAVSEEPADGAYFITASSRRFGRAEVAYDRRSTRDLLITLSEPATIEVTIAGYASSSLRGRLGVAVGETIGSRSTMFSSASPDESGRLVLGPLQPQPQRDLTLRVAIGHKGIVALPVALAPGSQAFTIRLPELHRLIVEASLDLADAPVWLTREGGLPWTESKRFDGAGRAIFDEIPVGRYTLGHRVDGMTVKQPVDIAESSTLTFRP